jgi:thiol-disulfide isomerase/thioredoxin
MMGFSHFYVCQSTLFSTRISIFFERFIMARKMKCSHGGVADWYPFAVTVLTLLLIASFAYLVYSNWDLITPNRSERFDNYETHASRPYVLYLFLMDGCGWCYRVKPDVALLQNASQDPEFGKNIEVRVVRAPADNDAEQLARDFSVQAFPSIVLSTRDQSKFWVYHSSSERSAAAITQWAQGLVADA